MHDVRRGRWRGREFHLEICRAARVVQLSRSLEGMGDTDGIYRLAAAVQVNDRQEDEPVRLAVEVLGAQAFDGAGDGIPVEQHGAKHGPLGIKRVRRRFRDRGATLGGFHRAVRLGFTHSAPRRSRSRRSRSTSAAEMSRFPRAVRVLRNFRTSANHRTPLDVMPRIRAASAGKSHSTFRMAFTVELSCGTFLSNVISDPMNMSCQVLDTEAKMPRRAERRRRALRGNQLIERLLQKAPAFPAVRGDLMWQTLENIGSHDTGALHRLLNGFLNDATPPLSTETLQAEFERRGWVGLQMRLSGAALTYDRSSLPGLVCQQALQESLLFAHHGFTIRRCEQGQHWFVSDDPRRRDCRDHAIAGQQKRTRAKHRRIFGKVR